MELSTAQIDSIVDIALAEDMIQGDVTTAALIPPELEGKASVLVRAGGVLAGGEVARQVFLKVDPALEVKLLVGDGARVRPGSVIASVSGLVASILKAERVALNFWQRLSGIASQTARYVARVRGLPVVIVDTRKTTPGLRVLEKYAVRMGGGQNHRFHLGDGVLIKDNHLAALRALGMKLKDIVVKARQKAPEGMWVEVEVNTEAEALAALGGGADVVMLDNMSPDEMKRVVGRLRGRVRTEASGGINLANVRAAAMTGVDVISIGALTHSVKALDISLELDL